MPLHACPRPTRHAFIVIVSIDVIVIIVIIQVITIVITMIVVIIVQMLIIAGHGDLPVTTATVHLRRHATA